MGRTLTHEIGHYLGLHHTWGSQQGDCTGDDGIEDTPPQEFAYYGCPTIPKISCNSEDYFFNFMNFVDDECLSMFTQNQKEKMQYCLNNIRSELTLQESCANLNIYEQYEVPTIFPNPTKGNINIIWNEQFGANLELYCYNFSGVLLLKKEVEIKKLTSFYLDTKDNLLLFIFKDKKGNCVHKQKVIVL